MALVLVTALQVVKVLLLVLRLVLATVLVVVKVLTAATASNEYLHAGDVTVLGAQALISCYFQVSVRGGFAATRPPQTNNDPHYDKQAHQ